ncbi:YbaB/EbfC family nucleoid-associated protein [Salinisphaera sp. P385]|uniref:Nucleoid-associated protein RM531_02245 n=2 Tax=Spectribacter acetivorans TaxID=3075603 RepID=A0ABU3B4A9_9GAMM|nr:YbaB/EbfC family nucleoid-associated protein [Salinisphaera sp. P385]MDT0617287.1 YbaB/EbfC family nucleoid-associated protein [Salinisphaera sp. P385]
MRPMKGSIGKLMQQAQEMQGKVQEAQEELANMEVTGEAGAGLVKIVMTGKHEVRSVHIDDSVFEEDRELLEDLLTAAMNDAVQKVSTTTQERMSDLAGGMNLPPGMNFPGM